MLLQALWELLNSLFQISFSFFSFFNGKGLLIGTQNKIEKRTSIINSKVNYYRRSTPAIPEQMLLQSVNNASLPRCLILISIFLNYPHSYGQMTLFVIIENKLSNCS